MMITSQISQIIFDGVFVIGLLTYLVVSVVTIKGPASSVTPLQETER